MDSKVTKTRLSNFFAYEWIMMIIVAVVAIIVMELIYTVLGVRVTTGQNFKVYYDESVYTLDNSFYFSFRYGEEDSVFSYDVLEFADESLNSEYNVLSTRLSIQEGDAIISDFYVSDEEKTWNTRANNIIDSFSIYSFPKLLSDTEEYLTQFLDDEAKGISKDNIDKNKVSVHFRTRMKKDNRFRSDEEKNNGVELEFARISRLCDEYGYLKKAFEYGKENDWFYEYAKYTFLSNSMDKEEDKKAYKKLIKEKEYFGLKLGNLSGTTDAVDVGEYFQVRATNNAEELILLLFDFRSYQPDLQFESVSFVNQVIRNCTGYKTADDIPNV